MTEEENEEFLESFLHSAEKRAEFERQAELREKVVNKPVEEWPNFDIKWDLKSENFRFVLDGSDEGGFSREFPNGLIIGEIALSEIQSILTSWSKRTADEVWTVGDEYRAAGCIVHWSQGNEMTPPLIELTSDERELKITGGNHRYAVCVARNVPKLMFLTLPEQREKISKLLVNVKWISE